MDLMDATYLVIAPVDEEYPVLVTLGDETRRALIAPAPAEFRYRLKLPERASLSFAIGITTAAGRSEDERLPGNRMRFTVKAGDLIPNEVLFERDINVARRNQWIEHSVDMSSQSGREVTLVFQTSFPSATTDDLLPVVGVFGEPIVHDRAHYGKAKGVVVISIDTLRRDHLSLYGYPRRTSPGLEILAEDAVVFDDAVSTSSWTLPAHASLFTSQYPSVHGAVRMDSGLAPSWPSLPRMFQDAGYFTQALVTHTYLSREYGFAEGFDRHRYLREARAEAVTDRALEFLTATGDRDFFLFLHYYDAHWHYDPPAPYDTMFDASYQGEASGVWWDFKELTAETIDPKDRAHILALYDGEIRYTDKHIERLLREMKRLDLYDPAMIVVTSDHGEEFLEHGAWEHQKTLFEEQLRIPLVVKYPNNEGRGLRVAEQVSLIDVAPTIAEVMGLPIPGVFAGRDLREHDGSKRELWAETEHTVDGSVKRALRRGAGEAKAIFSNHEDRLDVEIYRLGVDPGELTSDAREDERRAFERRLEAFLESARKARTQADETPRVVLDPEELERLEALGYIRP